MAKKQFQQSHYEPLSYKRVLGAILVLVIFFLLLTSVIGLAQKYFAIKDRSKELAAQQASLTAQQNDLSATNSFLATPEGTEESLRERYNYLKPGEQMIVITPDPNDVPPPLPPQSRVAHWWDELLNGLGFHKNIPLS
jgi:cell division protein FtsB